MSSNATRTDRGVPTEDEFRRACSKFATGIAILTTVDAEGFPHGMTVNSFTSVSLEPPLILVCIDFRADVLPRLRQSELAGISVLAEDQRELSSLFARRGEDRFGSENWYLNERGVPLLHNAIATFDCDIVSAVDAGDHQILIGKVQAVNWGPGRPLLYFDSEYRSLA